MRKLLFILSLVALSLTKINAQELKGFEIGEKYHVNNLVGKICGADFYIELNKLNDGTVFRFNAVPCDGKAEITKKGTYAEVLRLMKALESKYKVKLKHKPFARNLNDVEGNYEDVKDGVKYCLVIIRYTKEADFPYEYGFVISDLNLEAKFDKEQMARDSKDM